MTAAAAPSRGPGRPSTGVRVDIRIPAGVLAKVDEQAKKVGRTRAEHIRRIIELQVVAVEIARERRDLKLRDAGRMP